MTKYVRLTGFVALCLAVGGIGSLFTVSAIPTWYASLIKPSFSPPNWLFGPVWTLLYILMGVSVYIVWQKGLKTKRVRDAIFLFAVQLILNAVWSPIFFGAQNIFLALLVIVFLWIYILKTVLAFHRIDKTSAYLLYPYIAWVTFATILNFSIWLLNK